MIKRLFLSHSAEPSGAELGLLRLSKLFDPKDTAIAFAADGPLVSRFQQAGIATHVHVLEKNAAGMKRDDRSIRRMASSFWKIVCYGWQLGGWAAEERVSMIVAYSVKSLIYGSVASRRARVPLVWRVSDRIAPEYFGRINTYVLRMIGALLPSALIVNSKATLQTVWARGKRVLILPPGIEISSDDNSAPKKRPLKQVAMVGRLAPWKGQMEFIHAFERAFHGTDVKCLIIGGALFGEEEYEAALRHRVATSPCREQIIFTGAVSNVNELLKQSDVLVHASVIPEPFGAVVLEGMDAGCAVIATRPGGPAEVITSGTDGLLVPCGDVDALEKALERLLNDDNLRWQLAQSGKTRVRDYDIQVLGKKADVWLSSL